MSINYQIIGKRIREIRKREKISQEKLAERSELSTQYISQIETAARRASLTSLVNIAGALNVGIEELLYEIYQFVHQNAKRKLLKYLEIVRYMKKWCCLKA